MQPINAEELHTLLGSHDGENPAAIAFDGDGTLWSGDVGEDTFEYALRHRLLRVDASAELQRLARRFKLPNETEPNAQAQLLLNAYRSGTLPDREACELMAWAYAGWNYTELLKLVNLALDEARLEERWHAPVVELVAWARRAGFRTIVVSASPFVVIEAACARLGFSVQDLAACEPVQKNGQLVPMLRFPLPYAEHKAHAARRLLGTTALRAALGDNGFDQELLSASQLPIAVRPKAALVAKADKIRELRELTW